MNRKHPPRRQLLISLVAGLFSWLGWTKCPAREAHAKPAKLREPVWLRSPHPLVTVTTYDAQGRCIEP